MSGPRLIINADDYGLTAGVSAGIRRCIREGVVTSATVMVNREGAAGEIGAFPHDLASLGVHLVLTSGRPMLAPELVPSLLDPLTGCFPRDYRLALAKANQEEVEAEWRQQLAAALAAGARPSHLDSHHHLHLHPRLTPVIVRLAEEFGIGAVRSADPGDMALPSQQFTAILSGDDLSTSAALIRAAGLRSPTRLVTGIAALAEISALAADTVELCCHPGMVDSELRSRSSLLAEREAEMATLCSAEFRAGIAARGFSLINYRNL